MPVKKPEKPFDAMETNAVFARFTQSMDYFGRVHEKLYPLEAINYPQLLIDMQFLVTQMQNMIDDQLQIPELERQIAQLKAQSTELRRKLKEADK